MKLNFDVFCSSWPGFLTFSKFLKCIRNPWREDTFVPNLVSIGRAIASTNWREKKERKKANQQKSIYYRWILKNCIFAKTVINQCALGVEISQLMLCTFNADTVIFTILWIFAPSFAIGTQRDKTITTLLCSGAASSLLITLPAIGYCVLSSRTLQFRTKEMSYWNSKNC